MRHTEVQQSGVFIAEVMERSSSYALWTISNPLHQLPMPFFIFQEQRHKLRLRLHWRLNTTKACSLALRPNRIICHSKYLYQYWSYYFHFQKHMQMAYREQPRSRAYSWTVTKKFKECNKVDQNHVWKQSDNISLTSQPISSPQSLL